MRVDKRFSEGVTTDFLGFDDGNSTADAASQNLYGARKRETPFEMNWIYDNDVVHTVQERVVATYKDKRPLFSCTEMSLKNMFATVGQHCAFSTTMLLDENDLPLKNQIGLILTKSQNLAEKQVSFTILDSMTFVAFPPPLLDGSIILDGSYTLGGDRNRMTI